MFIRKDRLNALKLESFGLAQDFGLDDATGGVADETGGRFFGFDSQHDGDGRMAMEYRSGGNGSAKIEVIISSSHIRSRQSTVSPQKKHHSAA